MTGNNDDIAAPATTVATVSLTGAGVLTAAVEAQPQEMFYLDAVRTDGSKIRVWPNIIRDGGGWAWEYLVPDGVASVAGLNVLPGDIVRGQLQVT